MAFHALADYQNHVIGCCNGNRVPLEMGPWYDFREFGCHLGNVGLSNLGYLPRSTGRQGFRILCDGCEGLPPCWAWRIKVRTITALMIIALVGCTVEVPNPDYPTSERPQVSSERPQVYWNHNQHTLVTTARAPSVYTEWGGTFNLQTHYNHTKGGVIASYIGLFALPWGSSPITAAHSYGESFPIELGHLVRVTRDRLQKYASGDGWAIQVASRSRSEDFHIPASYIQAFLKATPNCNALEVCNLPAFPK